MNMLTFGLAGLMATLTAIVIDRKSAVPQTPFSHPKQSEKLIEAIIGQSYLMW